MADSFVKGLFKGQDPTTFDLTTLTHVLDALRNTLLGVATFWALIGLLMVGYQYFTAYGDEAKATQAKKSLRWIIIGMIVILLSEVIVYEVRRVVVGAPAPPIQNTTSPFDNNPSH